MPFESRFLITDLNVRPLFVAVLVLLAAPLSAQDDQSPREGLPDKKRTALDLYLTARQAYEMWTADQAGVVIVDVRTPEEYAFVGHAPMARSIPLLFATHEWDEAKKRPVMRPNQDFIQIVREHVGRDDILILMCRSGSRSARAVDLMADAGFTSVHTVVDGFEGDREMNAASPDYRKRTVNGWRNSDLPWTYNLDPELMHLPQRDAPRLAPSTFPVDGQVKTWGTLRDVLRDGKTGARVPLADLAHRNVYAVGALEGLAGEITVFDGEVWTSLGSDQPITARQRHPTQSATLVIGARVSAWKRIEVTESISSSELEDFLTRQAAANAIDLKEPFPFVIEGPMVDLKCHVVAGECQVQARRLGREPQSPPYQRHEARVEGQIVGIFAADAAGQITHMHSKTHLHVLLDGEQPLTGHVDGVGLEKGAHLWLPAVEDDH